MSGGWPRGQRRSSAVHSGLCHLGHDQHKRCDQHRLSALSLDGMQASAASELAQPLPNWPFGARAAGRSHKDAVVGCIVWSATASSSADNVFRSTSSRSRRLNASTVLAASYLRRLKRRSTTAWMRRRAAGTPPPRPGWRRLPLGWSRGRAAEEDRSLRTSVCSL
jgi:hypothetical protein